MKEDMVSFIGIKKWIDVSLPVGQDLPVWPGDPRPVFTVHPIEGPGSFRTTDISMGSHTGTHVDAPAHVEAGGRTLDQIPRDRMIGPCQVIEVDTDEPAISWESIAPLLVPGVIRLLLKTRNSRRGYARTFDREFQALTAEALMRLRERGYVAVGIDYLSAAPYTDGWTPHDAWLTGSENILIEGLDLKNVFPDFYYLMCLPLLLPGLDAAPARVMLGAAGWLDKKT